MYNPKIPKIITLLFLPGIGSQTISKIFNSSPQFEIAKTAKLLEELKFQKIIRSNIQIPTQGAIERAQNSCIKALDYCKKNNIEVLEPNCNNYPQPLLEMPSPPLLLFAQGKIPYNHQKTIAIIGTRQPTHFGYASAKKITQLTCQKGYDILSGLATGIDTTAHIGALENRAKTIAIIAHGHDTVYPPQNKNLFEQIAQEGMIYSEYPPGFGPIKYHFLRRDEIQAALSSRLILIETEKSGGAMHAINGGIKLGKKIGIVCGHKTQQAEELKNSGNLAFINSEKTKKQIHVLKDKEDVVEFLK